MPKDFHAGLTRPAPSFDPAKSLLNNDHFQIAYVTNDIERAANLFCDKLGVRSFRGNDNVLENGSSIRIRSTWIGSMMYEICQGSGPGMEIYESLAPPGEPFVLRFHHFGYLIPDEATWDSLAAEIDRGGWRIRSESDIPGFFKGCYVDAPELGHMLEYVLPRQGLLERMNATPVI